MNFQQTLELQEKSDEILVKNSIIRENDSLLRQMRLEIQERDESMADLRIQLTQEQQKLQDVHNSYSWRTGHFFFSLISKVFFWVPGIGKREH